MLQDLEYITKQLKAKQISETKALDMIIQLAYNKSDGGLMRIALIHDYNVKNEAKEREQALYMGLQDAIHIAARFFDNKQKSKEHRDVPSLINMVKAYFTSGTSDGASKNGKALFQLFLDLFQETQDEYLEGKSIWWLNEYNHTDYLKMVKEKNNL